MLTIEILLVLLVVWILLFFSVRAILWTLTMAVILILFTISPVSSIGFAVIAWAIFLFVAAIVHIKQLRIILFSRPFLNYFRRILPPMSITEREAILAGDVWWEGDLFRGRPDWKKLHAFPKAKLSIEEQEFLDNEVETLCQIINDWKIMHEDKDISPEIWDFLKENRFLGMVIDKKYGGLGFSAFAHSTVIAKIATRSLTVAINTMVPNSLGPGELLYHYGTEEQKKYYLPRLARGQEIPCFALTGIDAGSDAGAMTDTGIVCKGQYEGKEIVGISLKWNKRYITLAPIATVMGLAFKLYDPDLLIGTQPERGITVCLIPTNHPGVEIGRRHYPLGMAFMNGPIVGKDVFIPLDWVIGGPKMVGHGWRMLMECLSIGRGISLPSVSTAGALVNYRMAGAYAKLRKQFKISIGEFEGIQEALARIGGYAYVLEACRRMTVSAIDAKIKPAVASAIAKYHSTEINRKTFNDSMDIHAGRGIQLGPRNYFGSGYCGLPVGITVEGANILTRSLIIFGQGAIRCHPYILAEMQAVEKNDLVSFDKNLFSHIGFTVSNLVRLLTYGVTKARFIRTPKSLFSYYYRQLTRMSTALAVTADLTMLVLGGNLKRKESLSARLGDVLSNLYLASSVLKYYVDEGENEEDRSHVQWALEKCLFDIKIAFTDFFCNFPNKWLAWIMRRSVFALGIAYRNPLDRLNQTVAHSMMQDTAFRKRLTSLCYIGKAGDPLWIVEEAFVKLLAVEPIEKKIKDAIRGNKISSVKDLEVQIKLALAANVITLEETDLLRQSEKARRESLLVDDFDPSFFKKK